MKIHFLQCSVTGYTNNTQGYFFMYFLFDFFLKDIIFLNGFFVCFEFGDF